MLYPFNFSVVDQLNISDFKDELQTRGPKIVVWDDWTLERVESSFLANYFQKNFPEFEIVQNCIFISAATQSNFHIDRYEYFRIFHRVLIPLDEHYVYEWIDQEGERKFFRPKIGQVILFNNMIPHRFKPTESNSYKRREVVYLDLVDPKLKKFVDQMKCSNSEKNGLLEKIL